MKVATLDWGAASLPLPGESESGDKYVVETFDEGALVAVIDALGHGSDAARTAEVAAKTLGGYAHESPGALIGRCHETMQGTRGAAISVASFDWQHRTVSWLGIGNVTGVLMRADREARPRVKSLLVRAGIVGSNLPDLRPSVVRIAPGDTLIFATDGVRGDFAEILPAAMSPQALADRILGDYATRSDDALVLVFNCNGAP